MKYLLGFVVLMIPMVSFAQEANQLVAKDSNGLVIEIKEKYGGSVIDTCTAVIYHSDQFVVVHREGVAAWYPSSFHSVRVLERLRPSTAVVSLERDKFNERPLSATFPANMNN